MSASVSDGGRAPCWLVTTRDGRHTFVANTGSGNISSFAVTPSGDMFPCSEFIGLEAFRGGNLFRDEVEQVLESRPFQQGFRTDRSHRLRLARTPHGRDDALAAPDERTCDPRPGVAAAEDQYRHAGEDTRSARSRSRQLWPANARCYR